VGFGCGAFIQGRVPLSEWSTCAGALFGGCSRQRKTATKPAESSSPEQPNLGILCYIYLVKRNNNIKFSNFSCAV
jgi:hypothetical protein